MRHWLRLAGSRRIAILSAVLLLAWLAGLVMGLHPVAANGQESPMAATLAPLDDEPEPEPEAQQPLQPGAAPPVLGIEPGRAFPLVSAPLPPPRPFVVPSIPATPTPGLPAVPTAPAASAAAPTVTAPAAAPEEPASPADAPPVTPVPDAPDVELTPNMRIANLPVATQPATTEEIEAEEERTPEPTLVEKQTDAVDIACLQPELLRLVKQAGEHFGATPVITSGQRSRGRRNSLHRRCMAADFFVPGVERARLAKFLRGLPGAGGVGTYCHTKSVHLDTGDPRNWWQCGFRFRFAQR